MRVSSEKFKFIDMNFDRTNRGNFRRRDLFVVFVRFSSWAKIGRQFQHGIMDSSIQNVWQIAYIIVFDLFMHYKK